MKNILLLSALIFSAASTAFAQNNSTDTAAALFLPDSDVSVARGMTREAVSLMLGVPSETVATNVWIYWGFRGKGTPEGTKADTLVIVFSDDRVSTLRLCESKPAREYVAKLKAKSTPKTASAK
jgi:outer membrane protein assembly factor BamE (lipoprotein component of BamABCDE complex)